jgi:hypothetical protein
MIRNGQGMDPWHAAQKRGGGCDMPANDCPPRVDHLLSKPPRLRELRAVLSGLAS